MLLLVVAPPCVLVGMSWDVEVKDVVDVSSDSVLDDAVSEVDSILDVVRLEVVPVVVGGVGTRLGEIEITTRELEVCAEVC